MTNNHAIYLYEQLPNPIVNFIIQLHVKSNIVQQYPLFA
jgi:hypothetical protein